MKIDFKLKKIRITLLSLIGILVFSTGTTIAYLQSKTDPLVNSFTIGNVTTQIEETFEKTEDWVFNKQPKVKNTGYDGEGNTCYVRVRIVASPENQLELHGFENYEKDWKKGEDGYYYYQHPLKVGETTCAVFDTIEVKEDYRNTIEEFEVTVYQEAVQAVMTAKDGTTTDDMKEIWEVYEAGEIPETFRN